MAGNATLPGTNTPKAAPPRDQSVRGSPGGRGSEGCACVEADPGPEHDGRGGRMRGWGNGKRERRQAAPGGNRGA
ncbi:hypothetical protein GCM10007079_12380 [Nocardiopsis terrae]|nr:hypothetical protein GCM10007079_12380 [Nocardiopsis terrae]